MTIQYSRFRSALRLEPLESRFAPAKLLSATRLTYQDHDGDTVTVSFSKPVLAAGAPNTIFTFDSGPGAVNGSTATKEQLQRIDLTGVPSVASGTSITVTAIRSSSNGGDGFAAVGEILAPGIDLGTVKIDGDLGRILAGDSVLTTAGLKALSTQSIGRYQSSTGAANVLSQIQGKLGTLSVRGDVADAEIDVNVGDAGSVGSMNIGGSLIGGTGPSSGVIKISGTLGPATVHGDVTGGGGMPSGYLGAGTITNLTVGGDVIGGSATGNANLVASGFVGAAHIKKLTLGGSLIAGTDNTTGLYTGDGIIFATFEIGSLSIKGSVIGNSTNPAVIAANGQQFPTGTQDLAISSLSVRGRVERGIIEAGVAPDGNFNFVPTNADAQIGSVSVGGEWIASTISAGVVAGGNGFYGDSDDATMTGPNVKDDPAVSSRVGSVRIAGQVLGTVGGSDHFGVVAESVGSVSLGGVLVALALGNNNDDVRVGITNDFAIHEV